MGVMGDGMALGQSDVAVLPQRGSVASCRSPSAMVLLVLSNPTRIAVSWRFSRASKGARMVLLPNRLTTLGAGLRWLTASGREASREKWNCRPFLWFILRSSARIWPARHPLGMLFVPEPADLGRVPRGAQSSDLFVTMSSAASWIGIGQFIASCP